MTTAVMRDGTYVQDERLGRLIQFDERSRAYPARALLTEVPETRIRSYRWRVREHHDQRREGACVTFAHGHSAVARPRERLGELGYADLVARYRRAQQIDPWPETREGGQDGTSVLAGAKVFVEDGLYVGYRWAFTRAEALQTLAYRGPLVMGTWWRSGMFSPDPDGRLRLEGAKDGGHAWLAYGFVARRSDGRAAHTLAELDLDRSRVICRNSWGPSWGRNGDFWLTLADFEALRTDQGEACVGVERGGYFGG